MSKKRAKKAAKSPYVKKVKGYRVQGDDSRTRMVRLDFNFCNWLMTQAKKRQKPGEWVTGVDLSRKLYEHREQVERYFDR